MKSKFMPSLAFLGLCVAVASPASAALVSYEYEFDTPSFSHPNFDPVNSLLATAGPTITGSFSFDTDHANPRATIDYYATFSHAGELDDLFSEDALNLYVEKGGILPLNMFYWNEDAVGLDLHFPAKGATLLAIWVDLSGSHDAILEDQRLSNFTLLRTDTPAAVVPVPAGFVLLLTGIAALASRAGFSRRRSIA